MTPTDDPTPRPDDDSMDDGAGGYRLAIDNASPPVETPSPVTSTEADRPLRSRPPLPPKPFLTGTFSFPLSPGARPYVAGVGAASFAIFYVASRGILFSQSPGLATWLASAGLAVVAVFLALMWFIFASGCALAIVRETANGVERIGVWPGFDFLSYLVEPLYLINSACVSALFVVAFDWVLGRMWLGHMVGLTAGLVVFPVVLLSMLETASPLGIVSGPVWRTIGVAGQGWAAFYGTSTAMVAAAVAVMSLALWFGGLFGYLIAAIVWTFAWFIYFRLLGRLAWYCADRTNRDMPEEETDDEEVEELHVEGVQMVPFTFVFCPRCAKRVEVGRVPVGSGIRCSHCGLEFVVEYK